MAETLRSSGGIVGDVLLICEYAQQPVHRSIFFKDDPLSSTTTALVLQIFMIFCVTRMTHLLLRPLRQTTIVAQIVVSSIVAQIVAGIILGPTFLGQQKIYYERLFPDSSKLALTVFAEFGIMIHFFKIGVQIDPKEIIKIRGKAQLIGFTGYMVALGFGVVAYHVFLYCFSNLQTEELETGLASMVVLNSLTSFVVIVSFLKELNMLNSEIGRLALSTSMISDASAWVLAFIIINFGRAVTFSSYKPVMEVLSLIVYFGSMFLLFRPLVIKIANRTQEGKPMAESHFVSIICILLVVALAGQYVGQSPSLAAFMFGLFLPDGPPLGAVLAQRIDSISSAVLVPIYCTISGFRSDLISTLHKPRSAICIELILLAGYLGKFTGVIIPSLYYGLSYLDAFSLALIMCCKGIVDLSMLNILNETRMIDDQMYTLAVFTTVIMTGLVTPTVAYIYDPSRRYTAHMRRTIIDSEEDLDLRILVCIHNEDNVHSMINLLEASNPTRIEPFGVIVLQLLELCGRATTILTPNADLKRSSFKGICSEHIVNAFNQFEHHNRGSVMVEHFTAVAPYMSIHDDICSVALDKKASIIIVPFHQRWAIDGGVEASSSSIRTLNQNVLKKAPCSVGVLIDRSVIKGKTSFFSSGSPYNIAVLFLGGPDDQEALAFSMRMAGHPNVSLTVFRLISERNSRDGNEGNGSSFMEDILPRTRDISKVIYNEEIVKDGTGTIQIIKKMEEDFDLVIVGRSHKKDSPFTLGFTEWSEFPELGPIGDMLASPDFEFSVLVVTQQMYSSQKT